MAIDKLRQNQQENGDKETAHDIEDAKAALEYAISGVYGARERLKLAARGYLENTPGQHSVSGEPRTDVGVQTMVDSIQSEASYFRQQTTMDDARAIVKSADEVMATTRPVFQIMGRMSEYRMSNGSVDQLKYELETQVQKMLELGQADAAKELAVKIEQRILAEKRLIEGEADVASRGTIGVEEKISEEVAEFGRFLKQGNHNPSTTEHDQRLIRAEEAAKSKGDNFRRGATSASESVQGLEEPWQRFVAKHFPQKPAVEKVEDEVTAIIGAPPHSDGTPTRDDEWTPIELPE